MKRRNFIGYTLLFVGGCTTATDVPQASTTDNNISTELTFTVTDLLSLEKLERDFEAFRVALEDVLECSVTFYPVESYTEAAAALQSGDLDLALTGPSEYVLIRARMNAIPVIAITRPNYRSIIVVPTDNSIQTLADLKGKTIAMREVGSTSGHLRPTKLLLDAGLDPKQDYNVQMLDRAGLEALKNGEVDAWAGPLSDFERFLSDEGFSENDFSVLEKSPPLPNDVFVFNSNTDPAAIEAFRELTIEHQDELIEAIASVPENDKYETSELVSVQDSDYDTIRDAYRAVGQGEFLD
ncbi:MAG: phosphate/phosphite/phosphonate ABC transporter substrate-binding protein [Cyanobacteria bacterium SID2]|nr:phosphate/phosphite/phosphonate ABC transporter substrate-binding protein [Cyanobacteria bacterium SID2]MBP0004652.1 phosphate/phosphite/phosphonate ABC transporter substrate-binding protein [Cyanobacteria bacterium SBC]